MERATLESQLLTVFSRSVWLRRQQWTSRWLQDNAAHVCTEGCRAGVDWLGAQGYEESFCKTLSYILLYKISSMTFHYQYYD